MAGTTVFTVDADGTRTREIVDAYFSGRGWRRNEPRDDGAVVYEVGKRGVSLMLGAMAGKNFYLTAVTHVEETNGGARVRYVWGGADGIAGGALGVKKARSTRAEIDQGLEQALSAAGVLHDVQRDNR